MTEGNAQSRFVKLSKEQSEVEDIKPGELNQPIQVPQLSVRKCNECGQALPENFEPPGDEPWTTGIFGCTQDPESCRIWADDCTPLRPRCGTCSINELCPSAFKESSSQTSKPRKYSISKKV